MPSPDVTRGPVIVISTTIMRLISLPLYRGRTYARIVPVWPFSWDSYFLTAAVVCDTTQRSDTMRRQSIMLLDLAQWILLLMSISHGHVHRAIYVPPEDRTLARKYLFFSRPLYAWSLSCAKISVAWCHVRIQRRVTTWRMFLCCLVTPQVVVSIVINYFRFSLWDPNTPNATMGHPLVGQQINSPPTKNPPTSHTWIPANFEAIRKPK